MRPSSSTSGGRRRTSAPRRVSIICAVVREMPAAFLVERRAFALRGMGGGCGLRRDGGKRLAEFVVQLARKMAPLLVLYFDQLSRQGVAFGKRRLQPFGKGVEDAGDDRQIPRDRNGAGARTDRSPPDARSRRQWPASAAARAPARHRPQRKAPKARKP